MKNGIILAAIMAALCASGETVKTATQPWVRSYVATNRTDVSGKADATNVYTKAETDERIVAATNAIPRADLTAATNYTDRALGAFAATGTVARANVYGTPTRWTDATGCVWEVGQVLGQWTRTQGPSDIYVVWHDGDDSPPYTSEGSGWYFQGDYQWPQIVSKDASSTILSDTLQNEGYYGQGIVASFARGFVDDTNIVGRVALTNDIPRTAGDVGAYPAASGSALESGKQDRLPYPTNAIPFSAIDGAPSGGQEWRVVNYDVEVDVVNYVTNGIAILTFINAGYAYGINVSTNGWPEGASMFVRGSFRAGATYTIPYDLRLIGYGTWPTNNFQSVWWRSGTNIYVNVILEE